MLFVVERRAGKQFRQRLPDGTYKLGDVRRVPYRLPRVLEAVRAGRPVHVVEGEKDVHAVEAAGGVATCNPGGAGKWRREFAEFLRGASVVIVADRDEPGRTRAEHVRRSLDGAATSVRIVEARTARTPTTTSPRGTRSTSSCPSKESLQKLKRPAAAPAQGRVVLRLSEVEPQRVEWLWQGRLPRGKLVTLDGDPSAGKSTQTIDWATRVSTGSAWPDGSPGTDPADVLLLSAEDGIADTIAPRLAAAGADRKRVHALA